MIVTILGGSKQVTLRVPVMPALLSKTQTRKCEAAGLCRLEYVYKAFVDNRLRMVEFYYKPNFGQCYAIQITE